MIYIIGVDHSYQSVTEEYPHLANHLRDVLIKAIHEIKPCAIADEFNESISKTLHASEVISKSVASEFGLPHIYCEPNEKERTPLNILGWHGVLQKHYGYARPPEHQWSEAAKKDMAADFDKRENCWIDRIGEYLNDDLIFICGSNHIPSFATKLTAKGIEHTIIKDFTS